MGRISVPVQDLKDTAKELENIGELLGDSATLYHATGDSDSFKSMAGGGDLADALEEFDEAWKNGHERVHDNVKVFAENTDKISENFTKTDDESANALDDSKKDA
ncbi:hypothetical protein [Streptomyces sp. NPDC046862]|uniref:hypothetical protein n=1 Tax=Streptomyces sp. NPDC046862 TaxID=3154603 RepID=UPI003451BD6F